VYFLCGWLAALSPAQARNMNNPYTGNYNNKQDYEAQFSNAEYKMLDTFEANQLSKADAIFEKHDYKAAYAEYDAFVLQFPKSKALPYALLRKGRCLHLDKKRYEAIKAYNEVMDYFPNVINYASPALYYIGRAEWQNGDVEKAMKAWIELADDADYSKHALAADAINELADQLVKQNNPDQATKYSEQVALTFRTQNPPAAYYAIGKVLEQYVHRQPDEAKIRAFYTKVQGFEWNPIGVPADLSADRTYWSRVMEAVQRLDDFPADQTALKQNYFRYWAKALDGRFDDWDDYQIKLDEIKLLDDQNPKKWAERLDAQFTKYQKPGNWDRVIKWMYLYRAKPEKAQEYYNLSDYAKMDNNAIIAMTKAVYDIFNKQEMGRNTFGKIHFDKLPDAQKVQLARYFWPVDGANTVDLLAMVEDKDLGKMELLRYYAWRGNVKDGLPLCEEMTKSPEYAKEADCIKAGLLWTAHEWAKAITAYQICDNAPYSLWQIAECYMQLNKPQQAVAQLREVENFFKDYSAEAAIRIAYVYKRTDQKNEYIAALHAVLNKYPKSDQSNLAHIALESMGLRIGGGVNAGE
jgi:TolA-binding protein